MMITESVLKWRARDRTARLRSASVRRSSMRCEILTRISPNTATQRRILKIDDGGERRTDPESRHTFIALDDFSTDLLGSLIEQRFPFPDVQPVTVLQAPRFENFGRLVQQGRILHEASRDNSVEQQLHPVVDLFSIDPSLTVRRHDPLQPLLRYHRVRASRLPHDGCIPHALADCQSPCRFGQQFLSEIEPAGSLDKVRASACSVSNIDLQARSINDIIYQLPG